MAYSSEQLDKQGLRYVKIGGKERKYIKKMRQRKLRRTPLDEVPVFNKYNGYAT